MTIINPLKEIGQARDQTNDPYSLVLHPTDSTKNPWVSHILPERSNENIYKNTNVTQIKIEHFSPCLKTYGQGFNVTFVLTLSRTTNFRLFQTEEVCR